MNEPSAAAKSKTSAWKLNLAFVALVLTAAAILVKALWTPVPPPAPREHSPVAYEAPEFRNAVNTINHEFTERWRARSLTPADTADDFTIMRRLSLGLAGTVPSLEEIRALEQVPGEQRVQWWLSYLFEDRRTSDYLAERLARATVGVENGPFLVFRRRRMTTWMADEIAANRPYDELVRSLVAAEGVWTTQPEVNFVTATMAKDPETGKNRPDVVRLAARTTRAFLGVRIDCVQCHDDMFGDHWKQEHFHQLFYTNGI